MVKYWLWLTTRAGLKPGEAKTVLDWFGAGPDGVYFADPEEYDAIPHLSREARESLRDKDLSGAEAVLADCDRRDIRPLTWQDTDYPERLRNIEDPPLVLYVKGRWPRFDDEAAIAMAGTRSATPYGVQMAGQLAFQITRMGGLVVTGVVLGCDEHALIGALKAGGPVAAVLAGGVDVPYYNTERCRSLYHDVCQVGALVSEYPPGTPPLGGHFRFRNRILTGLSVATVCVEAGERSGTMQVASLALEQNRDLFTVPANADARSSAGTLKLLKEGALPATEGADVMRHYQHLYPNCRRAKHPLGPLAQQERLSRAEQPAGSGSGRTGSKSCAPEVKAPPAVDKPETMDYITLQEHRKEFTDDEVTVLRFLQKGGLSADELIAATGLPAPRAAQALTVLELRGAIEKTGQQYVARVLLRD